MFSKPNFVYRSPSVPKTYTISLVSITLNEPVVAAGEIVFAGDPADPDIVMAGYEEVNIQISGN